MPVGGYPSIVHIVVSSAFSPGFTPCTTMEQEVLLRGNKILVDKPTGTLRAIKLPAPQINIEHAIAKRT